MAGEHSGGEEEDGEVEGLRRLHGPEQGVPQGPIPPTQNRSIGGCNRGAPSNELPGRLPGLSSDTPCARGPRENGFHDAHRKLSL